MFVDVKTSMDKFEDIMAGEVFLFCEEYYLKTTMEGADESSIIGINIENGQPRSFKDEDLVLSVPGTFVEIDLTEEY